jgi:predicted nucleic acid-binding protein
LSAAHPRTALDANVLIYVLEGIQPIGLTARELIDAAESGTIDASMSTIGQTEVLTGPAQAGDAVRFETMAEEIRSLRLRLVPLDPAIAEDAAWLRGDGRLELADAIHIASAKAAGATAFVTNDRRIRSQPGLDVIYLGDIEPSETQPTTPTPAG